MNKMLGGGLKIRTDENESDLSKVKKHGGAAAVENTKRAALGDLQNRAVLRTVTNKDLLQKESLKNTNLTNAIRNAKARVDTRLKKGFVANATAKTTHATNVAAAFGSRILTRSNSVRSSTANNVAVATQRQNPGATLAIGQKPKTLTAKVVENKVQQVKYVTKGKPQEKLTIVETGLRREDSNLSRKSLTKIKAAINAHNAKPTAAKPTKPTVAAVQPREKPKIIVTHVEVIAPPQLKVQSEPAYSSKALDSVEDIDAEDGDNLVLVSVYVNDIYDYLFQLEREQRIRPKHLEGQLEVNPKMRATLVDWINEVHLQFRLMPETYHMAVAIIDRYLQAVQTTKRTHLQLVGTTALFIASKYEELYAPPIADFVYITDDSYVVEQILHMEMKILKVLDCNLSRPLPIHFLRRFSKAANSQDSHHNLSKYLLELCTVEYELACYHPSEIAAASLFLALNILNVCASPPYGFVDALWTPTLQFYSRYTPSHLRPITKLIAQVAFNAPKAKLKTVYDKYKSKKFQELSLRAELYGSIMKSLLASKE